MSPALSTATVSPKATTLPRLPAEDPLTQAQWKTLLAIAETIVPAVKPTAIARVENEIAVSDNEYSTAISTLARLTPEADSEAAAKALLDDSPA